MLFNSIHFLIFFPVTVTLLFALPKRFRNLFLLAASYYFYMQWNAKYILLIGFSTLATYFASVMMGEREAKPQNIRKFYLVMCLVVNLAILFVFKYYGFFASGLNALVSHLGLPHIRGTLDLVLPVGISFYTFQALSYTMDVYRGEIAPEKSLLNYALFVSFFPQLVAGPIERSERLLTQIDKGGKKFTYTGLKTGIFLMAWGYFLKLVIADRAALLVNPVFKNPDSFSSGMLLFAAAIFAFQLYCDFYSYSIIAKGAAEIMGYRLMDNFRQPFFAESIRELWHRWHISLSTWFRDYLYIPLGGSRVALPRFYFNVFFVFLISGLWHGAKLTFVVWGAMHGIYQIIGDVKNRLFSKLNLNLHLGGLFKFAACLWRKLFTFFLFTVSMFFFRGDDFNKALGMLAKSLSALPSKDKIFEELKLTGLSESSFYVLSAALAVLFVFSALKERFNDIELRFARLFFPLRFAVILFFVFASLIFGIYGPGFSESQFIYFQF